MAERGTCQNTERNRSTKAHSHPADGRGRLVRTQKEIDRPRRTHFLETAEGSTCQDTETNRPTEAHSHPGDGRGKYLSGHRKKPTDRGALTSWRRHKEVLVKTWKETDRQRRTHILETAGGGTCQDTERSRPTEVHSQTGGEMAEGGTCQNMEVNRPSGKHGHSHTGECRRRSEGSTWKQYERAARG